MLDDLTIALEKRTAHIIAARFTLENERHRRMAIEIKGLKAKAIKAGTVFERLNRAYDNLIETGDAHAGDVESLAPQLAAMQDDISFAVATLGNSVSGSGEAEKPVEKPNIQAGVGDLNQPKAAPEAQQAAWERQAIEDRTNRPALGPHPDQPEVAETASQQTGSASASADPRPNGADVLVRAAE